MISSKVKIKFLVERIKYDIFIQTKYIVNFEEVCLYCAIVSVFLQHMPAKNIEGLLVLNEEIY